MSYRNRLPRRAAVVAAAAGLALAAPATAFASPGQGPGNASVRGLSLKQVNLFSDLPRMAGKTDRGLVNPWGLAFTPKSGLWVAEQGAGTAGVYTLAPGATTATDVDAVNVTFPGSVPPHGGPAGQVANTGTGFTLRDRHPAQFIFATLNGRIEAWDPSDGLKGHAEDKAAVTGGGYTGLALARAAHGEELFAADYLKGTIDVFDSRFRPVKLARGQFRDPRLPAGYRPFNAQALNGHVFVTYDTENPHPPSGAGPEGIGTGIGIVDEYTADGQLTGRIATHGPLDAPWGLAIAPASWGSAAGSLLVGNFGDGRITVYARQGSHFAPRAAGQVRVRATGRLFTEPGLWALLPGTTATTGGPGTLWFDAGIPGAAGGPREHHGLLGVLRP